MATPHVLQSWVAGEQLPHRDKPRMLDNINPATGKVISTLILASPDEVDRAVLAAKKALPSWSKTLMRDRAALLDRVASAIEGRLNDFALAETRDQGKPLAVSRSLDIPRAIDNLRFFAAQGRMAHDECFSGEAASGQRFLSLTRREPAGPCALITPWNLPLYLLTWKLAPALVMGNTVVCKPSELTSTTACMLMEVLHSCGCPPGVVNLVLGVGSETGQALIDHPDIRVVSFTGGTLTGERIAQAAARGHKKLSLELGGKNASIVFDDADVPHAARVCARAAFLNQGQVCLAGSRILIHHTIFERFVDKLCEEVRNLRVGNPEDPATTLGPVVSIEHREKILSAVQVALRDGARRLQLSGLEDTVPRLGLPWDQGAFLNPSLLVDAQADHAIEQEEVFGPVATLSSFSSDDEAITRANSVRYGLSSAIFSKDIARAQRVSEELQCGTVWINTWLARDLRVPFGGVKASGSGREGGRWSLDFYSETKTIVVDQTQSST
jgi:acyl-CoA reductase-like NAD-dependent aldehyde dehydrogenase